MNILSFYFLSFFNFFYILKMKINKKSYKTKKSKNRKKGKNYKTKNTKKGYKKMKGSAVGDTYDALINKTADPKSFRVELKKLLPSTSKVPELTRSFSFGSAALSPTAAPSPSGAALPSGAVPPPSGAAAPTPTAAPSAAAPLPAAPSGAPTPTAAPLPAPTSTAAPLPAPRPAAFLSSIQSGTKLKKTSLNFDKIYTDLMEKNTVQLPEILNNADIKQLNEFFDKFKIKLQEKKKEPSLSDTDKQKYIKIYNILKKKIYKLNEKSKPKLKGISAALSSKIPQPKLIPKKLNNNYFTNESKNISSYNGHNNKASNPNSENDL